MNDRYMKNCSILSLDSRAMHRLVGEIGKNYDFYKRFYEYTFVQYINSDNWVHNPLKFNPKTYAFEKSAFVLEVSNNIRIEPSSTKNLIRRFFTIFYDNCGPTFLNIHLPEDCDKRRYKNDFGWCSIYEGSFVSREKINHYIDNPFKLKYEFEAKLYLELMFPENIYNSLDMIEHISKNTDKIQEFERSFEYFKKSV